MTRLRVVDGEEPGPDAVTAAAQAALAQALADGMVRGVILYEARGGSNGRVPIEAGRSAIRGLCLDTLDDLETERTAP